MQADVWVSASWFDAWEQSLRAEALARLAVNARARGFNERSAAIYRQRWLAFVTYCSKNRITGSQVDGGAIEGFLKTLSVRSVGKGSSSYNTQSRYSRCIIEVMQRAKIAGQLGARDDLAVLNDAAKTLKQAAAGDHGPAARARQSLVIDALLFRDVLAGITSTPMNLAQARDALVVQLCAREALSCAEVGGLLISDLIEGAKGIPAELALRGTRAAQHRRIALQAATQASLSVYLSFLALQPLRSPHLLQAASSRAKALSSKSIYLICAEATRSACQRLRRPATLHIGPSTLRNAGLAYAMSYMYPELDEASRMQRISQRAGLASSLHLQRLAHGKVHHLRTL
jgi:hypothetical protein